MRECPANSDMFMLSYYVVFAIFIELRNINLILHSTTKIKSEVILWLPEMIFALFSNSKPYQNSMMKV